MDERIKDRKAVIASYAGGPNKLEGAIAGLSEEQLDNAEREDTWTIRRIVFHIVVWDDLWRTFIKRAIGNPGGNFDLQCYWELPQEKWAKYWADRKWAIEPSLALFRTSRTYCVKLLNGSPSAWDSNLLVTRPNGDQHEIVVSSVVNMQAQHVLGHVDDIHRARQNDGICDRPKYKIWRFLQRHLIVRRKSSR